jgi:Ca2+-transporting ATPase
MNDEVSWHQHSQDEALRLLKSSREGLSSGEARERRARFGRNVLEESAPRSALQIFAAQFGDVMILVLIVAAVISGLVGDLIDTLIIGALVLLNALIGFSQEFRAARAMSALKAMAAPTATVLREGTVRNIPASDLVPGDAVVLEAGRIVPADMRLIESASLRVNESALTGESVPVDKITAAIVSSTPLSVGDRRNIAHKGTAVTYGRGVGVVIATGMRTELGRIAQLLKDGKTGQTPLQRRLTDFSKKLAAIVLAICVIVFITGIMRGEPLVPMVLTALSLAVAAIPEALPAVISVSLALGARRLVEQHALIRRLPAVETLGSVTFICSDKTGTLTTNEMRVEQFYCDGQTDTTVGTGLPWTALIDAMTVSHDAQWDAAGKAVGDPTEITLLLAAQSANPNAGLDPQRLQRIAEIPFDSDRKCMTTVHRAADGRIVSFTKGASDVILDRCANELRGTGTQTIDRKALAAVADRWAEAGLRVLAVAMRRWDAPPTDLDPQSVERDLSFIGLLGLIDPPRAEARDAIALCKSAGIVPVMITGDHPLTARAVAQRLGLLENNGLMLTGAELAALSAEELEQRIPAVRVYARVAPEQKVNIVSALQRRGEIVAMTGDGVNDAPALQRADIGVAMGINGTDVAKEASAMVLLDDNFATVVRAVREGRRIYDNLRRFVRFVLTTNSGEMWTIFLAPFLGLPIPLLPIQILWINLVTDGLPGLALAAEPAERRLMSRPPRRPDESIFAQGLGLHALVIGLLMAALNLGLQAWFIESSPETWHTVVFTALCFGQLAHVLAIRSEETSLLTQGLLSNKPLLGAVVLTCALQLAVVYVPWCNQLLKTTPLTAGQLLLCVASALVIFGIVEAEKWLRRNFNPAQRPLSVAVSEHHPIRAARR